MPFQIIRNDITKMKVDVIVNAANSALRMGGGVCGAIFSAAGADELQRECSIVGHCDVGEAVITSGCNLPADYIIHTVGPVWKDGSNNEEKELTNCYLNSLRLAVENDCESIAFPVIASGIYGYPKEEAIEVALSAIQSFLTKHELMVYLVVYDRNAFVISERLHSDIEKFIDDNYVDEHIYLRRQSETISKKSIDKEIYLKSIMSKSSRHLEDVVSQLEESFSESLLRLIDEKGMTDVETYKKANVSRKLFSKIRISKGYKPNKNTAISFAIALELNMDETQNLLGRAGYTLSRSNRFDIVIEYFIRESNYNIYEINEALFVFDETLLGM